MEQWGCVAYGKPIPRYGLSICLSDYSRNVCCCANREFWTGKGFLGVFMYLKG